MAKKNEVVLLIVPTVALAQDQATYLRSVNVKVCVVGGSIDKDALNVMFGSTDDIPAVLIATPETVIGGVAYKGILDNLQKMHYMRVGLKSH